MRGISRALFLNRINLYINENVKERSDRILKLWTEHQIYIISQRLRRGQQLVFHYRKLWEERALKELLQRIKKQIQRHTKILMFGSIIFYKFDWEQILVLCDGSSAPGSSMSSHYDEIDFVKRLKRDTIVCQLCGRRKIIDCKVEGIEYCVCDKERLKQFIGNNGNVGKLSEWQPYLERKNMIIWRKEEKVGLYAYKVYAYYDDITADDFLHVQTDIEYRKEWDKTAVTLEVIDSDPKDCSKSQIIYWEMMWPKLFSNRDYVYNRRYYIDKPRKLMVILNNSTKHPKCPVKPQNQRVEDYWSCMVIKPKTTFQKPGLEYVLTYFDNPGVVMPPVVTSWVAQRQMPDFLNRLHCATLEFASKKMNANEIYADWDSKRDPGFEYPPEREVEYDKIDDNKVYMTNDVGDEKMENNCNENGMEKNCKNQETSNETDENQEENASNKTTSWWSYLHPYYYFA